MEKDMVLEAYNRGLLSKEECTKVLGIDPHMLISNPEQEFEHLYDLKAYTR